MDRDNVSKPHAQIRAHDLVHPDLVLVSVIFGEDNADSVLTLLALHSKPDRVSANPSGSMRINRTE